VTTNTVASTLELLANLASRALCVAAVCAAAACGGGGSTPVPNPTSRAAPAPPAPAPADPAAEQRAAALAIYESGRVVTGLVQNLFWSLGDGAGRCFLGGRRDLEVDGSPADVLSAGSHSFSAAFAHCTVDGLVGTTLNGSVAGAYAKAGDFDHTVQVEAQAMSTTHAALVSDLHGVTVDGSLTVTSSSVGVAYTNDFAYTVTFTPTVGLSLANSQTGNALTFLGGEFSYSYDAGTVTGHDAFRGLVVEINGTQYSIDGRIDWTTTGGHMNYKSGIVRITSGGVLHANVHGPGLRSEVLIPLQRL
jgi:hypothetical protein